MINSPSGKMLSLALVMAGVLLAGDNAMSLEQPEYTVIYKDGDIEYRQYEPYLVAETVVANSATRNGAGNEGFRRLFRYITGGNQSRSEIAMTAPVAQAPRSEKIAMTAPVQRSASSEGYSVAFMLPTKYTLETAPVPTDERVRVRAVPARLMAVLRYSGRWSASNYAAKQAALSAAVDNESIERIGEFESALYDPPYTPPLLRRNEVMVQVDRAPASAERVAGQPAAAY